MTNFGASRFSQVLQFCLAYGGDPHRDTEGVLPTEAAAAMGALQALAMLLRIGAVPGGKKVGQWKWWREFLNHIHLK